MGGLRARTVNGLSGAAVISAAARRARALSPGGAVAATLAGGAVFAGAGTRGGATLVAFFLSSTVLGRLPAGAAIEQRRGNERDAVQVFANGGVAALLALASLRGTQRSRSPLLAGFGGATAAAAADTWATEIGSRSRQRPRSIATLRHAAPGVSGGVTPAGLAASAAGATFIAGVSACDFYESPTCILLRAFPVAFGGIIGSLADSVLGATVQEVRFCDHCGLESEHHVHHCGAQTRHIRGMSWCNNDTVNATATAVGAVTAIITDIVSRNHGVVRATWRRPRD